MGRLLLVVVAVASGALLVGPVLNHAIQRWIGWRGVVPLLLGWQPSRAQIIRGADGEIERPRLECRACGARLGAWGLPVFRWLTIGGRCRACQEPIARWALGVELATATGFGVAAARFGWSVSLLPVLVLVAGLVASSAVDLMCGRIPRQFVALTGAGVVIAIAVAVVVEHEAASLVGAVVGAVMCAGILGLTYLLALVISGGVFGFGDVRLGGVIGLVLGWLGWVGWPSGDPYPAFGSVEATFTGLIAASVLAVLAGLVQRVGRRQPYPFGPWLSLGGFVAALLAA